MARAHWAPAGPYLATLPALCGPTGGGPSGRWAPSDIEPLHLLGGQKNQLKVDAPPYEDIFARGVAVCRCAQGPAGDIWGLPAVVPWSVAVVVSCLISHKS